MVQIGTIVNQYNRTYSTNRNHSTVAEYSIQYKKEAGTLAHYSIQQKYKRQYNTQYNIQYKQEPQYTGIKQNIVKIGIIVHQQRTEYSTKRKQVHQLNPAYSTNMNHSTKHNTTYGTNRNHCKLVQQNIQYKQEPQYSSRIQHIVQKGSRYTSSLQHIVEI